MKKLLILISLVLCFLTLKAQDSVKWSPVINASFSAINIQYVGGVNSFEVSSLSAIAFGVSYQKYNYKTLNVDLALNINLLEGIKWGASQNANLGMQIGVGLFNNVLTPSIGWFAGQNYPCGMLNVSIIPLLKLLQNNSL